MKFYYGMINYNGKEYIFSNLLTYNSKTDTFRSDGTVKLHRNFISVKEDVDKYCKTYLSVSASVINKTIDWKKFEIEIKEIEL